MHIKVILEPSEEGGYTAIVPALPGCISEGDTREEALKSISHLEIGSVLSMQNGVLKNEQLMRYFGQEKILGAATNIGAQVIEIGDPVLSGEQQPCGVVQSHQGIQGKGLAQMLPSGNLGAEFINLLQDIVHQFNR